MKAPMPSCCRRKAPPGNGRTRPWRPWTGSRSGRNGQPLSLDHHRAAQRAARRQAPMPFRPRPAPISETLKLAAIVCFTGSGSTGVRMSRERPETPIIALTPIPATARRLALVWGLHCVLTEDAKDLDDMVSRACPHCASTKALPNQASASSSRPACRWERPAPPTCCASPMWAGTGRQETDGLTCLSGQMACSSRSSSSRASFGPSMSGFMVKASR